MSVVQRLMDMLPWYYQEAREANVIMDIDAKEIERLDAAVKDVLDQLHIETATWGLDLWEKEFGITPNPQESYAIRRSRLLARKRGGVTLTKERLIEIVLAYVNRAEITFSPELYKFTVKILSPLGVPALDTELRNTLTELRPAHLAFEIIYTYATWMTHSGKTWSQLSGLTWDQVATMES